MKKLTRYVVLIISLALIVSFFVPMWGIYLDAPQYPEGLGMQIWLNKISGDLNTINGLNHYIGMKKIYPDSIPELKIMPYLIGLLIAGGFVVFFLKKKWLYISWASFFVILGIVGMTDFYLWEYDYGHDLNPHAAIKVPGMNYQPPLLGSKQLLNFVAYSLPDIGGFIIMVSAFLALLFVFVELKKKSYPLNTEAHKNHKDILVATLPFTAIILSLGLFLTSCKAEPQPIQYGKEQCVFCKMTIADSRFGCELVTKKGKSYKFDSNECMINYLVRNNIEKKSIALLLTSDYSSTGNLIDVNNAFFIINPAFQSPMGANLAAFSKNKNAGLLKKKFDYKILSWEQTFQEISKKDFN